VLFSSVNNLFALLGRKATFTHSLTHFYFVVYIFVVNELTYTYQTYYSDFFLVVLIMRDMCVDDGCKLIFKNNVKAKRAARNIELPQYKWLLVIHVLKEDGIHFGDGYEIGNCPKCFKRYLKRRP